MIVNDGCDGQNMWLDKLRTWECHQLSKPFSIGDAHEHPNNNPLWWVSMPEHKFGSWDGQPKHAVSDGFGVIVLTYPTILGIICGIKNRRQCKRPMPFGTARVFRFCFHATTVGLPPFGVKTMDQLVARLTRDHFPCSTEEGQ